MLESTFKAISVSIVFTFCPKFVLDARHLDTVLLQSRFYFLEKSAPGHTAMPKWVDNLCYIRSLEEKWQAYIIKGQVWVHLFTAESCCLAMIEPTWFAWLWSSIALVVFIPYCKIVWLDFQQMRTAWNNAPENKYQSRLYVFAVATMISCGILQISFSTRSQTTNGA